MALFKVLRGLSTNLDTTPKTDGNVYFTTDTNKIYFDHLEGEEVKRTEISGGVGTIVNDDSIEFGDNTILSNDAAAFGYNNAVGCKGYYIKSIDTTNNKIYLSKERVPVPTIGTTDNTDANFETPGYRVGSLFSIIVNSLEGDDVRTYDNDRYKIKSVVNNVITYEGLIPYTVLYEDTGWDKGNCFYVSNSARNW